MNASVLNTHTSKAQSARTRLANKVARQAAKVNLEGGAVTYPDCLPGVGWVLVLPSGHKKYLSTLQLASDMWLNVYRYRAESYTPKMELQIKEMIREVAKGSGAAQDKLSSPEVA